MLDTIKFVPLQSLGYKNDYIITEQGLIIDRANQSQLEPTKNQQYRLTTIDGKKVYRAIKTLYRQAFGKEFAIDKILSFEGEVWKEIDEKGKYYISNFGRVKSYQRNYAKLLQPYPNQKGYLRVDLHIGQRQSKQVSRLVALAFVPNDNPLLKDTVDHIDLNKSNNNANNLRWLSRPDNIRAYYEYKKAQEQLNDTSKSQPKDN